MSGATEFDKAGSFARRDRLLEIERAQQAAWETMKLYESDADQVDEKGSSADDKFFATFPYPYMNGVLHLGHAFTLSKVEFAVRFQRMLGKKVLFPFGFHCTGMPIAACADRLKREIEQYGNPPVFPEVNEEEEEEKKDAAAPAEDGSKKPINKKSKVAKKAGKAKTQWGIMEEMGVPADQIALFRDPVHWLQYFPPFGMEHLKLFGLCADFRRSFITTDVNPYYDSFIRWQFRTLDKRGKLKFGKRLSIFSPIDNQPCADHDRASGEGVGVQEYTLIKCRLVDVPEKLKAMVGDKNIFLPAATLRPETMYGQTNLFLLPEGEYGVFAINDADVFVCSDRSALNMSYQDIGPENGKPHKLGSVLGMELMGCAVVSPLATYDKVYITPLLTIKMNKGTGVVTSVPSDAPDDWAALMDLKNKPKLREKYNIKDEHVLPYNVIPIIDTPGLGNKPAEDLCIEKKVKSQNDRDVITAIKERIYLDSFYKGVMLVGEFAGEKVSDAKPKIRQQLINNGQAMSYAEPESVVMSRSGNECVVALTEQWYLVYGEDAWKQAVENHINTTLQTFNPLTHKKFVETVNWLKEWGCSRSYGLGTKLPQDEKFLIESLSDSTIYMAYYTICHLLQGDMDGTKPAAPGIRPEQLSDEVWDYIFFGGAVPSSAIPAEVLAKLRNEFLFWYPMDLRVSGKDLIGNHLTMSLYNHSAVWDQQPEMMPRAFFTNGHLMINAEKMSKSTGNFLTLEDSIKKFSADATRIALADAGDGLEDANFEVNSVNKIILRLTKEEDWIKEQVAALGSMRTGPIVDFQDRVFNDRMHQCVANAKKGYEDMQYRVALQASFYELCHARDEYRLVTSVMHKDLIQRYMELYVQLMSPFAPHYCQHLWTLIGKEGQVFNSRFPDFHQPDPVLARQINFLNSTTNMLRQTLIKQKELRQKRLNPKKAPAKKADGSAPEPIKDDGEPNALVLVIANSFPEWQADTLQQLSSLYISLSEEQKKKEMDGKEIVTVLRTIPALQDKKLMKGAVEFANQIKKEVVLRGESALELKLPFDELAFAQEHLQSMIRDMGLVDAKVVIADAPMEPALENLQGAKHARESARPGKPTAFYYHAASSN